MHPMMKRSDRPPYRARVKGGRGRAYELGPLEHGQDGFFKKSSKISIYLLLFPSGRDIIPLSAGKAGPAAPKAPEIQMERIVVPLS